METIVTSVVQNGFAIAVAVYLLYERSNFNVNIAKHLVQIAVMMERIERRMDK